jgi:aspartyl aminopeptidase
MLLGANNEYLASSRIDDLECAYISMEALINTDAKNVTICTVFNNEEVGSRSANGAASTFLKDTTERIAKALNKDILEMLANSFIISSDNAHALHPNHPEKADPTNMVYMNKGIVVKHQAGLNYTTDALSEAIFKKICKLADVPYQDYTNRSDQRGGGTLGAISQTQLSIPSVDIGLAQLAMHSTYETCGVKDVEYMLKALSKFYNVKFKFNNKNIEIC